MIIICLIIVIYNKCIYNFTGLIVNIKFETIFT